MGRLPGQNATKMDKDGYLSVGEEEMLTALKSTLKAVEEGNITTDEYSFTFTTAKVYKRAGGLESMSQRCQSYWAELSVEMFMEVETAFEAVENGSLKEGGYYFELTTPYFHFTSGHYPTRDKDGSARTDDAKEPVPSSPWEKFSAPVLDIIWGKPLPLLKKLSEIGSMRPPGSMKIIGGKRNISCNRSTVRYILVFSVLMVHAEASPIAKEEQPVTLTAGTNGIVPFECSNEHQSASKYYTVQFEGKDRPFYHDGMLDPEGLMSPDQAERFSVGYYEDNSAMSIEISIASVSVEDQGTYIVMVIVQGEAPEQHLMKRVVIIFIPPGPAQCFLMRSESFKDYYQIHCHSKPGNGNSTLTCFQNSEKMRYLQNTVNTNQVVHSRIFWLMDLDIPFSCCAHDVKEIHSITQDSCNQYRYPRIEPVTKPLPPVNKAPTEIVRTTKPLPIEEKNQQPITENTAHSGCTQNYARLNILLSVMIVMTYVCLSNYQFSSYESY